MTRSIGLAYAITGTALASAVIAITASTAGLFEGASARTTTAAAVTTAQAGAPVDSAAAAPGDESVQYVYVDEPAPSRRTGEREHERNERNERYEHEGHEDDDD